MAWSGSPPRQYGTPSRADVSGDDLLDRIYIDWDLEIKVPSTSSPAKRQAARSTLDRYANEARFKINYLSFKHEAGLLDAYRAFEDAARQLVSSWVHKPGADADLLPRSQQHGQFFRTRAQQETLFECLLRFITPVYEEQKEQERLKTLSSPSRRTTSVTAVSPFTPQTSRALLELDVSPIPFALSAKGSGKRGSNTGPEDVHGFKRRSRGSMNEEPTRIIIDAIDNVPVTTSQGDSRARDRRSHSRSSYHEHAILSPTGSPERPFKVPALPGQSRARSDNRRSISNDFPPYNRNYDEAAFDLGLSPRKNDSFNMSFASKENTSFSSGANTSFTSDSTSFTSRGNASFMSKPQRRFTTNESAVFSIESSDSEDSWCTTQTSVADAGFQRRYTAELSPMVSDDDEETDYGTISVDLDTMDGLPELTPADLLRKTLENVFPPLPAFLESAPLPIRYEVTRVCMAAKVSLTDMRFLPILDWSELHDYDRLWSYMKRHEQLKEKIFPRKSDLAAWNAALKDYTSGVYAVVQSARLRFGKIQDDPLFRVELQPLKRENSHRLGRRFGNDRFLEMSLPDLGGKKVPKWLRADSNVGQTDLLRDIVAVWLTQRQHWFLGISWRAFCLKQSKSKKKLLDTSTNLDEVDDCANTVYFFATDGIGFQDSHRVRDPSRRRLSNGGESRTCPDTTSPTRRVSLGLSGGQLSKPTTSVQELLNWLIPLENNRQQRSLKLFSRIALGLSKTWPTVILDPHQILERDIEPLSNDGLEVMNDGCGRMSRKLAQEVATHLGLTYVPSGFQARIGGAKGFWIVDCQDTSSGIWIETYASQRKWDLDIHSGLDSQQRTFEVVSWARPLKSAALNYQLLPILESCAADQSLMRDVISTFLTDRLSYEIGLQEQAMGSPELFRKWIRDNSGIQDRLKDGRVIYKGGLPDSIEEQINMLLDSGFNPRRQNFLAKLSYRLVKYKCAFLKQKLNITVGRSTTAFMAFDFAGILEPDEVHLGFSTNFVDEQSGFNEMMLDGMDVLVARNPAHFLSDIQKVRAVWKPELKALKDVIVFSSTGNYSLAKKLSGGDYDGDIAWICFEPAIVDCFQNAEMPECPDLVQLGYLQQDPVTFSDCVANQVNPVASWLQHSFKFNLQPDLIGLATYIKESYCYTVNAMDNQTAITLSTLLSDLVDQRKQGYIFTPDMWETMKRDVIGIPLRPPAYKKEKPEGSPKLVYEQIIDHLKFTVADKVIDQTLGRFYSSLKGSQYWDPDLAILAEWASARAKESNEWKTVIVHLSKSITSLLQEWKHAFPQKHSVENAPNFPAILSSIHDKWRAIVPPPHIDPVLTQALLPSCFGTSPDQDYSTWSLLKASLGFRISAWRDRSYVSSFIWWVAGRQLAYMKCVYAKGEGGEGGGAGLTAVTPRMYAMLRPDGAYVKLLGKERELEERAMREEGSPATVVGWDEEGMEG